jgi:hypothetical protein
MIQKYNQTCIYLHNFFSILNAWTIGTFKDKGNEREKHLFKNNIMKAEI